MILLSFDTEEFDVPREQGVEISLAEGLRVSKEGMGRILDVLEAAGVKATFFCTGNFAEGAPEVVQRIIEGGHEVGCHGVDHFQPKESDVVRSKEIVECVTGRRVYGYRQPRMFHVDDQAIRSAGYRYNSSLNPAFIPGRYMHLTSPRTWFVKDGVVQMPASVTPWVRFPLFWLSLHHLPQWLYLRLVVRTLRHDGYFTTYFHPWEFVDLGAHPEWKIPYVIRHHTGEEMVRRLKALIEGLQERGATFGTYMDYISAHEEDNNPAPRV
ncbi:MAG: polysaccharide deacetylase family protein [Prevotella sp.]|nr:polysaccharide deacetylase family protein [Prevotella sp.]